MTHQEFSLPDSGICLLERSFGQAQDLRLNGKD
jgi:hypothetical protein